jgi:hypothetical protein
MDRRHFFAQLVAATWGVRTLYADEATPASGNVEEQFNSLMNVLNKTAGGKQFWADVWFYRDWRIQCHSVTGHYRLLDGSNRRHVSGTYDDCINKVDEIRKRDNLQPMQGKAAIVLHGLFRTRSCMSAIGGALTNAGGYTVFCMGYPTTRGSVETHARSLDSVVRSLEGISELNFIGHSLGNLVVRHWLKDFISADRSLPKGQTFGRMVMLAPPNHQPQLATALIRGSLARLVAGPSAEALASGWETLAHRLGTPNFEFGILAGGKQDAKGFNPLLPGDDDGVVTVESTRLAGARDFRILPVLHSFFMNDKRVHEHAIRFLQHGHFVSAETRQPVTTDLASRMP